MSARLLVTYSAGTFADTAVETLVSGVSDGFTDGGEDCLHSGTDGALGFFECGCSGDGDFTVGETRNLIEYDFDSALWISDAPTSPPYTIPDHSASAIGKVTLRIRAKRSNAAGICTIDPSLNGTQTGVPITLTDSWAWYTVDLTHKIGDITAWTWADIIHGSWGVKTHEKSDSAVTSQHTLVSEYLVDVYSPDVTVEGGLARTIVAGVAGVITFGTVIGGLASCLVSCSGSSGDVTSSVRAPITTLNTTVLRANSPAYLGDQDVSNPAVPYDGPTTANPAVFNGKKADSLGAVSGTGTITSIEIFANGFYLPTFGGADPITYPHACIDAQIQYTAPSGTATAPAGPLAAWDRFQGGPTDPSPLGLHRTVSTGQLSTQPNGAAWTWAAVLALTNITPLITISNPGGDPTYNRVCEIWVQVNGISPAPNDAPIVRSEARPVAATLERDSIGAPVVRTVPAGVTQQRKAVVIQ